MLGSTSYNGISGSIFTNLYGSIDQVISSDNAQQKAAGVQNAINSIVSTIMKLMGTGEEAEAARETALNAQNSSRTVSEAQEVESTLQAQLTDLQTQLTNETDTIKQASEQAS